MAQQATVDPQAEAVRAFLLYGNAPVGGIAVCFVLGTYALLGLPLSLPLLGLAFCGTFLVYQAERVLWPAPEDHFNQSERLAWGARHRRYVGGSTALAAVVALGMLPFLRLQTLGAGALLALLSLLYMLPLPPRRGRLKAVWFVKPAAIAGAWAAGGVLLPVLEAGAPLGPAAWALAGYRFLFVLPNALLADWPDRDGDARAGLQTVAMRCSEQQLRTIGTAALVVGGLGGTVALLAGAAPWLLGVDLAGVALLLVLVRRSWPPSRFFFGFLLDLVVAWPGITALSAAWIA